MIEMRVGSRIYRALAVIVALGLIVAGSAAAQATTPSIAEALAEGQLRGGWLTGNRGGAFHYYKIDYPGDGRVVTISFDYAPWDPILATGVGFNVYGNNGYHIGQGSNAGQASRQVKELRYSDDVPATWLIQVYNYIPDRAISYRIKTGGFPAQYQEPVAGLLPGNSGGSFHFYGFQYTGDESDVQVKMVFTPDNPMISPGIGFVIYGPQGEVARGRSTGRPTERHAVFSSDVSGHYQIQVYNYIGGVAISYSLEATPQLQFYGREAR